VSKTAEDALVCAEAATKSVADVIDWVKRLDNRMWALLVAVLLTLTSSILSLILGMYGK
jgi:hypothetical protein